jgi:membrane protease YdiL (CAAX protease family)
MHWSAGARQFLQSADHAALYSALEAYVLGLALPAALLALVWRRSPADFGLRWPDRRGWRWTLAAAAVSVPVGLLITALAPPRGSELAYAAAMLSMLPEHFLICGVGVALLLPARRLPHFGDAGSDENGGLSLAAILAMLGSTALFILVHVGARPADLAFSLPMGLFCAWLTWRTASIWPALFSHWTLNLAPLGLRALF